jgi:hypothetical protein
MTLTEGDHPQGQSSIDLAESEDETVRRRRSALLSEWDAELHAEGQARTAWAFLFAGLPRQARGIRFDLPAGFFGLDPPRGPRLQTYDLLRPDLVVDFDRDLGALSLLGHARIFPDDPLDRLGVGTRDQDVALALAVSREVAEKSVELLLGGGFGASPSVQLGHRRDRRLEGQVSLAVRHDLVSAAVDIHQLTHMQALDHGSHMEKV